MKPDEHRTKRRSLRPRTELPSTNTRKMNYKNLMSKALNVRLTLIVNSRESDSDEGDVGLAVEQAKPKLAKPRLYQVVMLNDDYTPMEFVVQVLQLFFFMENEKATQIMLDVHNKGKAVCGVYPHDIAETKMLQVNDFAKENNHPLKCNIEAIE